MKIIFVDYSLIFLCLFFIIRFVTFIHVMNLLIIFSFLKEFMFLWFSFEYTAYVDLIIYFGAAVVLLNVNIVYDRLEFYLNILTLFLFFISNSIVVNWLDSQVVEKSPYLFLKVLILNFFIDICTILFYINELKVES